MKTSAAGREEFECEVGKIMKRSGQMKFFETHFEESGRKSMWTVERNVKKHGGGTKKLWKLLRGEKKGIRNKGKAGMKRIWQNRRC